MAKSGGYSGYFNFSTPKVRKVGAGLSRGAFSGGIPLSRYEVMRDGGRIGFERRPGFGEKTDSADDLFDAVMAGLDAESSMYTNKLKGIYDKYQLFVADYEGDIEPVVDEMYADIARLSGYVDDYDEALKDMEDTFVSGIEVEPSAMRRRSEYVGAVADQYGAAEKGFNRSLAAQGINPYAGAKREFALERAGAVAGAANRAFSDWREQRNLDVVARQQGMGRFAELKSRVPGLYSKLANIRGNIAGVYGNVLNAKVGAQNRKAIGYEGLLDRTEQRRSEALALKQNRANIDLGLDAAESRMRADLIKSGMNVNRYRPGV